MLAVRLGTDVVQGERLLEQEAALVSAAVQRAFLVDLPLPDGGALLDGHKLSTSPGVPNMQAHGSYRPV